MTRLRFYVGGRTKQGGVTSYQDVETILAGAFGGFTATDGRGAWQPRYTPETCPGKPCSTECNHIGAIEYEPTRVYEVLTDKPAGSSGEWWARVLATLADQSSVLWTREEVEGGFS